MTHIRLIYMLLVASANCISHPAKAEEPTIAFPEGIVVCETKEAALQNLNNHSLWLSVAAHCDKMPSFTATIVSREKTVISGAIVEVVTLNWVAVTPGGWQVHRTGYTLRRATKKVTGVSEFKV